jgi:hypothetical protein
MAGNKKPRKPYKPGRAISRIQVSKLQNSEVDSDFKMNIQTGFLLEVRELTEGVKNHRAWDSIAEALNVSIILAEQLFDNAYIAELTVAANMHRAVGSKAKACGFFKYDEATKYTVLQALDVHVAQLEQTKFKELCQAMTTVKHALKARHALPA